MTTERAKRKLTAIFSADVKEYSRLMGEDEEGTVRTLTAYREIMSSLIQQDRGRVVDSPGDNLLAEFISVVDAVQCAVEIQQVLKAENAELPENRQMKFRLGINLGDVMKKETDKIKDDMPTLRTKMLEANIIVLATPIYWHQLSGKMKLFVDRWTDFINADRSTDLKGKGLALLSSHSGINVLNNLNILQLAMLSTAQFPGMTWMGGVGGRARMPWDWDDEPSLAEARSFGKKLAQDVNLIGQKVL